MAATGHQVSDTSGNGGEHGGRDAVAVEPEKALAARERLRAAAAAARQRRQQEQQQSTETTTDTSPPAAAATADATRSATGGHAGGVEARAEGARSAVAERSAGRVAASGTSTPGSRGAGEDGAEGDSLLAMLGVRVARQEEMETVLGQRLDADAAQRETLLRADRARIHLQVSHPSLVPPATQDTRPKPHAGNGRERRKV